MKVGVYGGTFNPIHKGHIALARHFLTAAGLDEVWFVVSPQNPFKVGDKLLDDDSRLEMVGAALAGEDRLVVSDFEFHLPKPSYMWHTLQAMNREYPDTAFTLLIGGDNWTRFDRWYHSQDILDNYRVAVYPRQDDPIDATLLPANVQLLDAVLLDISSTQIREMVKAGQSIDHLVPPVVARMIAERGWYR